MLPRSSRRSESSQHAPRSPPQVAMRALGFGVKKADVLQLMEDFDLQRTGYISYDQFVEIMTIRISMRGAPPPRPTRRLADHTPAARRFHV